MKVQVIRAFESHSGFVTKKEQTGSGRKFLKSPLQVCRGPSIPYLKINTYFSVPPLLRRVSQPSGQDQKNDKQTVSITILVFQDYSQGYILPYSCKLLGLYLSPEHLFESSLKSDIPPSLPKILKLMVFRLKLGLFSQDEGGNSMSRFSRE